MKIAVALSGGVDSSFAAFKLKSEGNEVKAFTFKVNNIFDTNRAKIVAEALGIEHHTIDISKAFNEKIINYFVSAYLKGYTPNPCAICNREIKSDLFIKEILKFENFDYFASGHYVEKVEYRGKELLKEHKDRKKSQTYFLSLIKPSALKKLIFPLENEIKENVKKIMLENFSEIFKEEKESFEVCFIKEQKYYNFIRKRIREKRRKGYFVDSKGKILGEHSGFYKYTIGQRRGLRISAGEKLYVYKIEPEKNLVFLGDEGLLMKKYFFTKNINWFLKPDSNEKFSVRTRFRGERILVEKIEESEDRYKISLSSSLKAITPGQLASFYIDEYLIGGAIIERD